MENIKGKSNIFELRVINGNGKELTVYIYGVKCR